MHRVEFLQLRIAALKKSIQSSKKMISLCEIVKDTDAKTRKADIAEQERRIAIDRELLALRETELANEVFPGAVLASSDAETIMVDNKITPDNRNKGRVTSDQDS